MGRTLGPWLVVALASAVMSCTACWSLDEGDRIIAGDAIGNGWDVSFAGCVWTDDGPPGCN